MEGEGNVLELIRRRASVRRFLDRGVPDEVVEEVVAAGQRAPFTGQMYSVVVTSDPEVRERLGELYGALPRVAPLFALVCVDFRRLERFVAARGRENRADDLTMLFLGIQDAAYAAQNMVLAAEALGLGSCFLGAAPRLAREMTEIFGLPSRVYPLVGLVLGYPAESPPPRPRIPTDLVLHRDRYRDPSDEDVERALAVMDAGLLREGYYGKYSARRDAGSEEKYGWGEHVARKYSTRPGDLETMLGLLAERGIDLRPGEDRDGRD